MSEKLECKRCVRLFTSEEAPIGKCPVCNGTLNYQTNSRSNARSTVTATPQWSPTAESKQKINEANMEALVAAQNRTTYAVRSLALYFFISLQTALVGGGLFGLAVNNESHYDSYGNLNGGATFFAVLGAIIALVGFYVAVFVGRQELNKSKP